MVIRDRLKEFQEKMAEVGEDSKGKRKGEGNSATGVQALLDEVKTIDDRILEVRQDVDQVQKQLKDLLFTPGQKTNELRQLEKLADKIYSTSSGIQKEIGAFRTRIETTESKNLSVTEERMITSHLDRLGMQTNRCVNDLKAAQAEYIDKTQKRNKREVEIVNGSASSAVTASHHDPNDPDNNVFVGNFLEEMQAEKLKLLEDRSMELQKLEKSVTEVNQLFKEVNALVMEQGEHIDNIEKNVEQTVNTVTAANKQLDEAEANRKKALRKKCCCIGVLVAVIVVVSVVIVIIVVSQQSGS